MKMSIREEIYRFIFENSLDSILLTSPDGSILRANPSACEMFQKSEEDILDGGRAALVDLDDPRLYLALKERDEKGKVRAEVVFVRKDGSKFLADVTSAIFSDSEGKKYTAMIIRDVSQVKESEAILRQANEAVTLLAMKDYLTRVMNRRAFIERMEQEICRSVREEKPFSLLMLDLDYFKEINDRYGHQAGDIVLKEVARCLENNIRNYDILARFGGDEFIICLPESGLEEATAIAERIRVEIEGLNVHAETGILKTTASFGIIFFTGHPEETIDSLISKVDRNMYRAKSRRNCVITIADQPGQE